MGMQWKGELEQKIYFTRGHSPRAESCGHDAIAVEPKQRKGYSSVYSMRNTAISSSCLAGPNANLLLVMGVHKALSFSSTALQQMAIALTNSLRLRIALHALDAILGRFHRPR